MTLFVSYKEHMGQGIKKKLMMSVVPYSSD